MVKKRNKNSKSFFQIFHVKKSFKKEFRRQVRLAVIAAVGFLIAFSWRNALYNSSQKIVEKITSATGDVLTELYTAIFITFLGVLLILISSRFLKEKS
jgi:uncharacterized membrane protein